MCAAINSEKSTLPSIKKNSDYYHIYWKKDLRWSFIISNFSFITVFSLLRLHADDTDPMMTDSMAISYKCFTFLLKIFLEYL